MLDNVKQLVSEPTEQVAPAQPQYMSAAPTQSAPVSPMPDPVSTPDPSSTQPIADNNPTLDPVSDSSTTSAVAEPAQGFSSSPMPDPVSTPDPVSNPDPIDDSSTSDNTPIAAAASPIDTEQLAGMKQQALDHLEPLVGHLDQSPEEAFKTTMMMIQANDNHTLLEKALDEAKKIEDDKVRANAMLDIINEINYFSQASQDNNNSL